jgi:hypothetical protein
MTISFRVDDHDAIGYYTSCRGGRDAPALALGMRGAYKKAIELDPQYGSAYASMGLAEAYLADAQGNSAELERAKEDVEKGIALAASSSLGYRYRAWIRMQMAMGLGWRQGGS